MRLSRICAESGLMPTLSPRHMLPLLKFRHLLSGRCRVKRPFSTTLSFRSRPAFCISLIPKLPAYLFTPSKGVVLSRNSSAPSEGVQFSRVFCSPSEGAQSPGALCRACTRVFVSSRLLPPFSSRLLPPSEGVQFSRVFCSPSEGAQSPGALCRVCARVSVSSRLLPPSEGAQSHGALCSACIRVSVSSRLFPPSEGGPNPAVSVSPLEGVHVYLFRNGSRFRISLPLWKRAGEAMLSREPVAMV